MKSQLLLGRTIVLLFALASARTMCASSPDYIVTTSTGASIVPGTTDVGNHCDDCVTNDIALPFPVIFYDQIFTTFDVSSNGHLTFTSADNTDYNFCLPHDIDYIIAPASYDLYTADGGSGQGVFTSVSGTAPNRIFNIEWRTQYCCTAGAPINNFEVRLYEGQRRIDFIYGANGGVAYNGIGVQRDTGSQSTLPVGCGSLPAPGTQYTFTIPETCVPPPPNMVAWWRGDGNADDSVGGHHGSLISGVTFSAGEVDQAFSFSGGSAHVTVPDSPALNPSSEITIDTWVKSTGSGFQGLVGKSHPPADQAYDLGMDGTMVQWRIPSLTPFGLLQVNAAIADGEWHHVAATYDGATMALYIDGALAGSASHTGAIPDSSVPLIIGAFRTFDEGIGFSVDGEMDEVELFDRALSAQEITDIYIAGSAGKCKCTPPPDNMISWWPLEGNTTDIQGDNDGTLTGGVSAEPGKVGGGFDFDGTTGYVNFGNPASLQLTNAITVDAWVRPDTTYGNYRTVVTKWSQNSGSSSWGLFIADNILYGYVTASGGTVSASGGSVPFGATAPFSHVAMTYSNVDGLRIYLNGVQVGSSAGNGDINAGGDNVQIGNDTDLVSDRWFDGVIDEVEIFSSVLNVIDIAAIYNAGGAGKCRPCTPAPSGMTNWWPGDNNTNDIQGGNDGTLVNGATFAPGKVEQAFGLDGVDDYVTVDGPVANFGTGDFTIDLWMQTTSSGDAREIINKRLCGVANHHAFEVRMNPGGTIDVQLIRDEDPTGSFVDSAGLVNDGQFHHIAIVRDGDTLSLYIDGALDVATTHANVGATNIDNNLPLGIGGGGCAASGGDGTATFSGVIDEVELFSRALSASEVADIYNAGSGGKCKSPVPAERQLVNISTRASVGTGDNVAIGGFILRDDLVGPRPNGGVKSVLIRALGPSLNVNGTPVPGRLADTVLELHDSGGGLMTSNDDWGDEPNAGDVAATGLAPADSHESAILITIFSDSPYTAILRGKNDTTGIGLVEVYDLEPTGASHLVNISTRGQVLTGDDVLIGGIIVQGGTPVRVLIRGLGPSLTAFSVANVLADPILELHDGNGALMATNDDWTSSPDVIAIAATGLGPNDTKESAILFVPAPGPYTAIVSGGGATPTGVGMVEAYRLGPP